MRRNNVCKTIAMVGAILLLALPTAARATKAGRRSGGDPQFKSLIDRYYVAWSTLNPDNAAEFYARDASLVFFDIAPLKYNGWAEYKEGVKKNFIDTVSSAKLTPNDDLKVTRRGGVVWTSVTFHLSGTTKAGAKMEVDGRHTAIWEKQGAKWVIVHEHLSAPMG